MNDPRVPWFVASVLCLGQGLPSASSRAGEPPALEGPEPIEMKDDLRAPSVSTNVLVHEAIQPKAVADGVARVAQAPPPPIAESPKGERPSATAQWVGGYWDWSTARNDYAWVAGDWRVPPPGSFWVDGQWKRDDRGWYRMAGSWSKRQTNRVDWRAQGPPSSTPEESVGPPPGPDAFFIPGSYVPDDDGVLWKPGFWARAHPGWDWVPARWVRQASGWSYREGSWVRARQENETDSALTDSGPAPRNANHSDLDAPIRHSVARPAANASTSPIRDRDRADSRLRPPADAGEPTSLQPIPDAENPSVAASAAPERRPGNEETRPDLTSQPTGDETADRSAVPPPTPPGAGPDAVFARRPVPPYNPMGPGAASSSTRPDAPPDSEFARRPVPPDGPTGPGADSPSNSPDAGQDSDLARRPVPPYGPMDPGAANPSNSPDAGRDSEFAPRPVPPYPPMGPGWAYPGSGPGGPRPPAARGPARPFGIRSVRRFVNRLLPF